MPGAVRRRRDRGAIAVEFALVAPVIMVITLALVDIGHALQQVIRLEAAARAGAQVAFGAPGGTDAIRAAIRDSLRSWPLTTDRPAGDVTVTTALTCMCLPPSTTTFNCSTDDPASRCGAEDFRQYVSIAVSRPYTPLLVAPFTTLRGDVEIRLR